MNFLDKYIIFLAKNSVARYQKQRWIRGICRKEYRLLSNLYRALSPKYIKLQNLHEKGVIVDTYPWPYCEAWFADWEEDDSKQSYSLVSDDAGFVVKYSASYCAWKINELTGSWPSRPEHLASCDAKHWHRLLFHNNYRNTARRPEPGKHYVGIAPTQGEHGECVWFEGFNDGYDVERSVDNGGKIVYSTYRDKQFVVGSAPAEWYIWVEIDLKSKK